MDFIAYVFFGSISLALLVGSFFWLAGKAPVYKKEGEEGEPDPLWKKRYSLFCGLCYLLAGLFCLLMVVFRLLPTGGGLPWPLGLAAGGTAGLALLFFILSRVARGRL